GYYELLLVVGQTDTPGEVTTQLIALDLDSLSTRMLVEDPAEILYATASLDGRYIAYSVFDPSNESGINRIVIKDTLTGTSGSAGISSGDDPCERIAFLHFSPD